MSSRLCSDHNFLNWAAEEALTTLAGSLFHSVIVLGTVGTNNNTVSP